MERFGRVDVLINNAGITHVAPIVACRLEDFERVIDVNLIGTFLGIKHVAPHLTDGTGAIVNTSSIQGMFGRAGTPAYTGAEFVIDGGLTVGY